MQVAFLQRVLLTFWLRALTLLEAAPSDLGLMQVEEENHSIVSFISNV